MERQVIAVFPSGSKQDVNIVYCNDGTVWNHWVVTGDWEQLNKDLPQPPPAKPFAV